MPWCAARPCRAAATDGLFANSVPNCLAGPCRGSCLPCGWLWWLWLWPVARALVTSGDTKVTVCLFYGIVPNVIVYIDIYYIWHYYTYRIPACPWLSPCVCLGHPAAACRCQCGCPSAGCLPLACPHGVPGRHEGGRQVVVGPRGCRLPPWPESVSGCLGRGGAVPGQPPRGGRCSMAGRCGPSGLHVWPLPRCGSARAVARGWLGCRRGGVFSVWKRGIFVFCTIFHRHYLHLVVFMCYLCNR